MWESGWIKYTWETRAREEEEEEGGDIAVGGHRWGWAAWYHAYCVFFVCVCVFRVSAYLIDPWFPSSPLPPQEAACRKLPRGSARGTQRLGRARHEPPPPPANVSHSRHAVRSAAPPPRSKVRDITGLEDSSVHMATRTKACVQTHVFEQAWAARHETTAVKQGLCGTRPTEYLAETLIKEDVQ